MRRDRKSVLRMILNNMVMTSQADILRELSKQGFDIVQGTLSKDLCAMKASRIVTADGYRYILPDTPLYHRVVDERPLPTSMRSGGYESLEFSGNVAVMKTRAGYAAALGADIDAARPQSVVGTVAGHDTLLLVMREGVTREAFLRDLGEIVPAVLKLLNE